ncbi:lipase ZK262.3-like [Oculina patagonica]
MFGPVLCFFVILPQLTVVEAFVCNDKTCDACVSSGLLECRWCKRDNECHAPGAVATNPCKRAENILEKSHCDDKLSRYDPELSMKMLYLSAVAYDQSGDREHQQKCLDNSLETGNFQLQSVVTKVCDVANDHDCSGYVAVSHTLNVIVVAFRGSKHFDQAFAQFLETLFAPKVKFFDGEVQTYWKRGFDVLWPSMEAEVKDLVSQNPSYQIWVTGHSLGGAMASLASTWLSYYNIAPRKNIILYTFGMPRVGNYDYALQHDQLVNNSWRVVNDDDAVPHFPSVVSLSIINGPYHHGVEAFYSEEATSVYSAHRECHGKWYNEDMTCSFSEVTRSFDKHKTYFSIPIGTFWKKDCLTERKGANHRSTPVVARQRSSAPQIGSYMLGQFCQFFTKVWFLNSVLFTSLALH